MTIYVIEMNMLVEANSEEEARTIMMYGGITPHPNIQDYGVQCIYEQGEY